MKVCKITLPFVIWALLVSLCISPGEAATFRAGRTLLGNGKPNALKGLDIHWAVLVAGSRYFYNYRHQADVCHAYQLLKANGLDDDHIITMVFDDIAYHPSMPTEFRGRLFNSLEEIDVYSGCAKDYTGFDVNTHNLLAVLTGNKPAVQNIGSGRVVESDSTSNIFMFYSDHGSPGAIYMPSGQHVYANVMNDTLAYMNEHNLYNEMVIYLESCESGSMFEGVLPSNIGVYAMTASSSTEQSWATFCPSYYYHESPYDIFDPLPDKLNTCLGDLFSVAWMEDTVLGNIHTETLHQQYVNVHDVIAPTSFFADDGSHVEQFGSISIDKEVTGNFLSNLVRGRSPSRSRSKGMEFLSMFPHLSRNDPLFEHAHKLQWRVARVEQRDADIMFFMHEALRAEDLDSADAMLEKLRTTLIERDQVDKTVRAVVGRLHIDGHIRPYTHSMHTSVEHYVVSVSNEPGKPLVDDWECLKEMVDVWERQCGELDDYSRKYFRTFANLCNAGVEPSILAKSTTDTCIRGKIKRNVQGQSFKN